MLDDNLKSLLESLVIDGDGGAARDAAYRIARGEVDAGGPDRAFLQDVIRAYRADTAGRADAGMPGEVAQLVFLEHPEETFDPDRYLVTEQAERIAAQVRSMRLAAPRLRVLGLPARNTTLLYGPPGTGKTEMARWIAYREGLPLMYVNMSSTVDSLMGRTAKNISQIFRQVRSGSCILMVDEIDCIANTRASAVRAADGELNRTTVTFMQEIDRLPPGVVLLAATNRYDMLDPALLRRFSKVEEVERLPRAETRRLLDAWAGDIAARTGGALGFAEAELDGLVAGYDEDGAVTQATVVQRATALLARKAADSTGFEISSPRPEVRTFRVIDAQTGADVTDDRAAMAGYVANEEWARPLKYSSLPEGFLLDAAGRVRLYVGTAAAVAPRGRFDVLLSRFAEGAGPVEADD